MKIPGSDKTFEHEGRMVTYTLLSEETGIPRNTISSRYNRGYRGKDLVAPGKFSKWDSPVMDEPVAAPVGLHPAFTRWVRVARV